MTSFAKVPDYTTFRLSTFPFGSLTPSLFFHALFTRTNKLAAFEEELFTGCRLCPIG